MTFTFTCIGLFGGIGKYGYYDDYSTLFSKNQNYPGQFQLWLEGSRPVGQLILRLLWIPAKSIDDLIYLHVMGVLLAGIFSSLVYLYFVRKVENTFTVCVISTASVLLSAGIILIASWPQNNYGVIALIVSTIACLQFDSLRIKRNLILVVILSTLSFLTYQPSAILFILLPTVRYFLQVIESMRIAKKIDHKQQFIRIFQHYLVLFFTGLVAISVFKIAAKDSPETVRTTLIGPLNDKLNFLIHQAIPTQINFQRTPWSDQPVLGFICIGIIIVSVTLISLQSKSVYPPLLFLTAAVSSLAPNFLTGENWASSRSLLQGQWFYASLTLIGVTYFLNLIPKYNRPVVTFFSIGLVAFSIVQSNQTLNRELRIPQLRELNAARIAISKLNPDSTIYVVKSSWNDSLAPWVRADEFGIPSTAGEWVPVPLTKLILIELYGKKNYGVQLVDETKDQNQINYKKLLEELRSKS